MADGSIGDYRRAKVKAARTLGLGEGAVLPSNEEVAAELRAYQSLFGEDEDQAACLRELRQIALDVMKLLADFRPYLTGTVLDGTAGRFSEVEIQLFADSGKDVEIYLLSRNIIYEIITIPRVGASAPESRLRLDWNGTPILLSIYPYHAEREWRRSPYSGRSQPRAAAGTVAALLAD